MTPETAVAALRARYPGVQIWYGNHTGRYWAILAGQLIEASSADELGRMLEAGYTQARRAP